jgi:hypothetical protein
MAIEKDLKTDQTKNGFKVADGGIRAWMVCLAAVWVFGMYLGFEFNYGLIYAKLIEVYRATENHAIYAGNYKYME